MANPDLDLLLGRLAVHYQVLSREQVKDALQRWHASGSPVDFGDFLTAGGLVSPDVLRKLLVARTRYLERGSDPAEAMGEAGGRDDLDDTQPTAEAIRRDAPADSPPTVEAMLRDALDDTRPVIEPPAEPSVIAQEPPELAASEPPELDLGGEPAAPPPTVPAPAAPPATQAPPAPRQAVTARTLLRYGPGVELADLLRQTLEIGASDLHVHSGSELKVRIHGRLIDGSDHVVDPTRAEELIASVLGDAESRRLAEDLQVDFAFALPEIGRFRANAYRQQRGLDAVFRAIPPEPPSFEDLKLPASFERFASFHQGIVLFTGPAGCGKSSTMAATVAVINRERPEHIITIEDPIEFVHRSRRCIVNQREVGPHTASFGRALRAALREDPDVIVIGELRDLETISLALTAAETGHLVLATLHTSSAVRTINRLLGVFPPDQQAQIRMMLSESLRAVISQRLILRADGRGRVAAAEVLLGTRAVGNLIREEKTFQLISIMQTGTSQGMCLLDNNLLELVKNGIITKEAARQVAEKPENFAGRGRQQQALQIE